MYSLSNNEISLVINLVDNAEITYSHLRDDLIDHLCCDIENEISAGNNFHAAFEKVKEKTGLRVLRKIQEDTITLINKRYRFMKNTMKIFGVITLILLAIGATFKIFHWPGASILLILGFLLMVSVFFPATMWVLRKETKFKGKTFFAVISYVAFALFMVGVLFKVQHWSGASILLLLGSAMVIVIIIPYLLYQKVKSQSDKKLKTIYIVGFISLIIYLLGFMFKIQHWPGAAILLILGSISLTSVFLPIFTYNKYGKTNYISAQFIFLTIAIVYFNMFTLLLAMRSSTNVLQEFVRTNYELKKQNSVLNKLNSSNYQFVADSLPDMNSTYVQFREKTDSLLNFIDDIKIGLIQFADEVDREKAQYLLENQEYIKNKSNINMVHFMMFGQNKGGYAYDLKNKLQEYNLFIRNNFKVFSDPEKNLKALSTDDVQSYYGEIISWENQYFHNQNVVNVISNLSIMQRNIQIIENVILHNAKEKILAETNK